MPLFGQAGCSSDINPAAKRNVRRRIHNAPSSTPNRGSSSAGDLPLNSSLKRDWARGWLSAKQVQDYALGAQKQGAKVSKGLPEQAPLGNIHRTCTDPLWPNSASQMDARKSAGARYRRSAAWYRTHSCSRMNGSLPSTTTASTSLLQVSRARVALPKPSVH